MARFAPASCSPCGIAQAIERLFATPKTTAVRPFKSSNMDGSSLGKKNNSILVRVGRTLLSAVLILGLSLRLIWIFRINYKTNVNGSGQECPLHTNHSLATPPQKPRPPELEW